MNAPVARAFGIHSCVSLEGPEPTPSRDTAVPGQQVGLTHTGDCPSF